MSRIRSTPFIHLNMHSCVYLGSSGLEKCHQLQPDCLIQHHPFCTAQRCNHQNPCISPFLPISHCTNEAKSSRLVYSSTKSSTQGLLQKVRQLYTNDISAISLNLKLYSQYFNVLCYCVLTQSTFKYCCTQMPNPEKDLWLDKHTDTHTNLGLVVWFSLSKTTAISSFFVESISEQKLAVSCAMQRSLSIAGSFEIVVQQMQSTLYSPLELFNCM